MTQAILQYGMYLVILVLLAIPLGRYMGKVMNGERVFLSCALVPCERFIYRVMHVRVDEEMSWKKYAASVLLFSLTGFIVLFLIQVLQGVLPGNPQGIEGMSWHLSFNTAPAL